MGNGGLLFDWDPAKAASNLRKHGVAFEEAETVFDDPLAIVIPDPVHSYGEERQVLIGRSAPGNTLVVVHVEPGERIRIISARAATKQERRDYEHR